MLRSRKFPNNACFYLFLTKLKVTECYWKQQNKDTILVKKRAICGNILEWKTDIIINLHTFATESPSDFGKSKMMTPAPRLASFAAAARPRPEAAPVTIADIPKTIFSLFQLSSKSYSGRCWPRWLTFVNGPKYSARWRRTFRKKEKNFCKLQILAKQAKTGF